MEAVEFFILQIVFETYGMFTFQCFVVRFHAQTHVQSLPFEQPPNVFS